jgi:conjugative relaxase-like TrwC/TraI family protein
MITIAKLGVDTAQSYYKTDYSAATNRYYSQGQELQGRWQGELAAEWDLVGPVTDEQYNRLTNGQHPHSGDELIRHRPDSDDAMSHIAAWDLTFRPGKSVSLAALVGGDPRLKEVVRNANDKAMAALESYVQQRMGGLRLPVTTAKWIVATFEHDTARPVDGYAAPLLHHHNVVMNMTAPDVDAQMRALWTKEFYKAQTLGEAVYQSEIARGARALGYNVKKGPSHAMEIVGFSKEYLDAESPRNKLINARLAELGMSGSVAAAKLVAMESRESKLQLTPNQVKAVHRLHGEAYGDQAQKIVSESVERGPVPSKVMDPEKAVEFARHRLSERLAVFEHYEVVRDALTLAQGALTLEQVEAEVNRRIDNGGLVLANHVRPHAPAARYTTPELVAMEQDTIARMKLGQNSVEPILAGADLSKSIAFADNPKRLEVIEGFLKTRDQVTGMNGAAGSAKSTSIKIIADHAIAEGFSVQGLAPTGTAATALSEKGVRAETLQLHLVQQLGTKKQQRIGEEFEPAARPPKVLYLLDEASLVSARQMNAFFRTLRPQDRAILIGDDAPDQNKVGQHTAVEAGRPFYQLQAANMKTAQLNKIYRQKTPWLKDVVLSFRAGDTERALNTLNKYDAIHEVSHRGNRFKAIGEWFAESPYSALVVSPDNESRRQINAAVREAMRAAGYIKGEGIETHVLVPRDVLSADRTRAENYRVGDVLRYVKDVASLDVKSKSYATVTDIDAPANKLTVKTANGRQLIYDPSRTGSGVSVFETQRQAFAEGDQVQFTAADKNLGVTNRTTGVIESLDAAGQARFVLSDTGRRIHLNLNEQRHLDYAYTSTSHSSQSRTVERCAAQVDTSDHRLHALINKVFSYVAGSRPEYELAVFTDNKEDLARVMGREHEVHTALTQPQVLAVTPQMVAMEQSKPESIEQELGMTA